MRKVLLLLASLAVVSGCGPSTEMVASWSDPAGGALRYAKAVVAFQSTDQALRRSMEDSLAARIPNATQAYRVLTDAEARDPEAAKAKLVAQGFDGAVVTRFVGVDKETTYVPGTTWWGPAPYATFGGYWGYGWGAVYDPGYLRQDTVVTLESAVYSLKADKLRWAGRSRTFNPSSAQSLVDSVVSASADRMRKEGVL